MESVATGYSELYDENVGGSGFLIICPKTKRMLLGRRSGIEADNSGEWCNFGGTVEPNEDPMATAFREVEEETGTNSDKYRAIMPLLFVDEAKTGFKFATYLGIADNEFEITINDEHDKYGWYPLQSFPHPMHPGMARLLSNPTVMRRLLASFNGDY
jgi:8-oxo-dGTP pyrophosphatase MutT (NUDIX family)